MSVAESGVSLLMVTEVNGWLGGVDVVELFQHGMVWRRGGLEGVHLGGVGQEGQRGRMTHLAQVNGGLICRSGKAEVITIAIGSRHRFELKPRSGIIEGGTDLNPSRAQIWIERAGGRIELALAFGSILQPT